MVSFSAPLVGCTLLLLSGVRSAPLETNPVTLTGDVIPLTELHPAYGAALEVAIPVFAPDAPVITTNETLSRKLRQLEATNRDVAKLEARFGHLERHVDKLPLAAEFTPAPWPGSYWPVYRDGINARWDDAAASPAEKYARAFKLDVKQFMDAVSAKSGILSQRFRPSCRTSRDCYNLQDGSTCGKRADEQTGRCIPTWFGVCHAWAPASILEPEPKCPVTVNEITFQPADIKALITQLYDGARVPTIFTGARYDGPVDAEKDDYGRFKDPAYRDLGPGFFHLVITNLLGRLNTSFVIDATAGPEVWNQPVRGYEILETTKYPIAEGSQKFYKTPTYPFNANAEQLAYVRNKVRWVVESEQNGPLVSSGAVDMYTADVEYQYVLELDRDGNIIGGEWLEYSNDQHPDFLWLSIARPNINSATSFGLKYGDVQSLLQASITAIC